MPEAESDWNKREAVRDSYGDPVIRMNGRVYSAFLKDLLWPDTVEALWCELHQRGGCPMLLRRCTRRACLRLICLTQSRRTPMAVAGRIHLHQHQ